MQRNGLGWIFLIIAFAGLLLMCAKKESPIFVRVGDQVMDVETFVDQFKKSQEYENSSHFTVKQLKDFSEKYLVPQLLFQAEGYARMYDVDSALIAQAEADKRRMLTRSQGPLYRKIVPEDFDVSEEEIRNFYDHLDQEWKLAHILVKSARLADSLYEALQKGENFGKLAYEFSVDLKTNRKGGEIGRFVTYGYMGLGLDSAAYALPVGAVSKPIKTVLGYHIIRVLEKRPRERRPLEEIRQAIRQKIKAVKMTQWVEDYITGLYEKYRLRIDESSVPIVLRSYSDQAGRPILIAAKLKAPDLQRTLVTYDGGEWRVKDFINIYNATPLNLRVPLRYKEDVEDFIRKAVSQDLMYEEAKKLGLDRDPSFLKQVKLNKDRLVRNRCLELLVTKRVHVKEDEIRTYYENNRAMFGRKSLNEARPSIESMLRTQRLAAKTRQVAADLQKKHPVEYSEDGLKAAVEALNESLKN